MEEAREAGGGLHVGSIYYSIAVERWLAHEQGLEGRKKSRCMIYENISIQADYEGYQIWTITPWSPICALRYPRCSLGDCSI